MKTSELKECDVCHYWYFLDKEFNFQPGVCNGRHDVLLMCMNLRNTAILNINDAYCRCIISENSKSEAVNLLPNIDLTGKSGTL